ncbi:S66 peptidase family protein [Actinopolymorpha cephalotaxi]|uniref:Muramoyltetrapeptide carboxypeptidase n=1 Tax=Actinopolymorpha cephalotaxi TaxID=504797 RepID=A0ABX2S9K5_9ACTN|nr:LD-carboxypeptidase [Actinopolymorpha cephalotaxi]NYH86006.1 muramoyltetrapeptide carboxypeptidase [Actinopolymorpha cephalotaxi]
MSLRTPPPTARGPVEIAERQSPAVLPPRLRPGDRVRFVSPASPPSREGVERGVELLTGWGLRVEVADHVFDQVGYLAGSDEDRLADVNAALRDPGVRAVFATRGGKGAYRIAGDLDFDAARRDPKPLVGFSDITHLHLALWRHCRLAGMHGPFVNWYDEYTGPDAAEALRRSLTTTDPVTVHADPDVPTAKVSTEGTATGFLLGGNLTAICTEVGADLPSLDGAILFVEDQKGTGLGQVDRQLTQLLRSGALDGVRGVTVGQFPGFEQDTVHGWTILDVLRDRLGRLGVPILGGIPAGHAKRLDLPTLPLGTEASIDTSAGTLTIEAGVR